MKSIFSSRETMLSAAIVIALGLIATRFPAFIEPKKLLAVFNDTSPLIILAIGQMIVILTKCIDLSVAANLALSGMIVAMMNGVAPDLPIPILILIAISIGTVLGAFNGVLVWKLSIPSIVVTLGTMTIFRGIIFVISDGKWVNAHEMTPAFKAVPREVILGLPGLSWFAIFAVIFFSILLTRTPLGRTFFAVGSNPNAAVYTGISVGKTQFCAFAFSGALSGLAGYLWVARYSVAYVDIAIGFELEVVAACVIGGVAISGGIGSIAGAVLGALFLGVIKNALPVINISPFWQMAISGSAIIIAIALNTRASCKKGRVILKSAELQA